MTDILLKNVLEPTQYFDGPRYLIESTWPENLQDFDLCPYRWVKELVPSYELAESAKKNRWSKEHFRRAYWMELDRPEAQWAIDQLLSEAQERVTFLYAPAFSLESNASYLKEYIRTHSLSPVVQLAQQPIALAA